MPKKIQKSLQDYLSKIKNHHSQIHIPSKKWILPGCKHSRTTSLVIEDISQDPSLSKKNVDKKDLEATLADIHRFLMENFKSLYIKDDEEIHDTKRVHDDDEEEDHSHHKDSKQGPILFDESPSKLSDYNRFFMKGDFFSSLIERDSYIGDKGTSSSTTSTTTFDDSLSSISHLAKDQNVDQTNPEYVVVLACSSNPYDDFHQSMKEMVEARLRNNEVVDWDYMEQLFFYYMNLNDKKSYKFILNAFVDLVAVLRPQWETSDTISRAHSVRTVRSGKEVRKKNKEVM
ncbi:PREDICTED: transcription repressor OFP14-like [Lupinus angustifolius]|uniref:transcription repressor OFP14-like n=1 Tax=Lupinus angustifolius TaxID=3871 RepID=UPI00092F2ED9|nr:PREDICTED: transcription repressor OFP14-like [Lupinus angustifolius]